MASTNGRPDATLSEQYCSRAPYRFDFFQAVRLLERLGRETGRNMSPRGRVRSSARPGSGSSSRHNSLSFPAAPIHRLEPAEVRGTPAARDDRHLHGVDRSGWGAAVPLHAAPHSALALKDHALRDFFDLFNHRAISLFYRAWEKYRLASQFERSQLEGQADDLISGCLYGLAGLGTAGQRRRHDFPDTVFLYYGGHFAHFPRNAGSLAAILQDYFNFPITLQQMHGQWLCLEEDDRTRLPRMLLSSGRHLHARPRVLVGDRVWDVQSKFRLRLGPLSAAIFYRLLPGRDMLRRSPR